MTFSSLASGESVFLDANVLIYDIAKDPIYGQSCRELIGRIETGDLVGFTSA